MGARAKIAVVILLIIIVAVAVWQFTSPPLLPPVGNKYTADAAYSNRGSWLVLANMSYEKAFLGFSIANISYPRTGLPTDYSLVISDANQTLTSSYVRGFGLRITSVSLQDNYDGSTSVWGVGNNLSDAVQATGVFNFQTSAVHKLRLTVRFQLYELLAVGSLPDKTLTESFNITQSVL